MSEIVVNDPGIASQVDVNDCIAQSRPSQDSAVSQWIADVILISNLSTSLMPQDPGETVGQMLVATMVSSTENYFRTLLADLVHLCPWTGRNVADATIPYASVHTFEPNKIGFGLVEGVLFSSKGTIASQLKRFTRYKVSPASPLDKAITAFDSVCAIRHAAVHWSGRFDTRAHGALQPEAHRLGQHHVQLDLRVVQDCLAACDYLVRTTNQLVFDLTLARWLDEGYLGVDVDDQTARKRASGLSATFAESRLKSSVTKQILRSLETD